jgi:hypothetical protein
MLQKKKISKPLLLLSHGLGTNRCFHEEEEGMADTKAINP